jgi:hypothetical protein
MRSQIFLLALASTALMGVTESASVQSPYSYPWCSRQTYGSKGATTSCYFTNYAAVHDNDFGHWRLVLPEPRL